MLKSVRQKRWRIFIFQGQGRSEGNRIGDKKKVAAAKASYSQAQLCLFVPAMELINSPAANRYGNKVLWKWG